MCAIAGFFSLDPGAPVDRRLLKAMADAMAHRGPDGEGFLVDGSVGLAHRRLSIIDIEGGTQPIWNEDRTVAVVFNGEIYNHEELRPRLEGLGHRFRTRSDTEVIVHLYEEHGDACVESLRGMFAFALWDARRRRLLLARDRLGIKPLYVALRPGLVAFASEVKALLLHPAVPAELDPEALDLYLALRYVPGPRTMFRGIEKLQPGHLLVADRDGVRVRAYWDVPHHAPEPLAEKEARERFMALLEESVRLRLMADVPLGVFLSGGLDSTSVLAVMSRVAPGERFDTFTVGYDPKTDASCNEFPYARIAADAFGAHHHELSLGSDDFQDSLRKMVWHLDEPVADPACIPLMHISRLARSKITVVLSGEGADEILGGYGIYRRMLALERWHRLLGSRLTAGIGRLLPGEKLSHYGRLGSLPLASRYRGVSRGFLPGGQAELLPGGDPARAQRALDAAFAPHFDAVAGAPALAQMLYVDLKTWLPDDLLTKADKMTMANGQELRVPFLDHRLVELAATLPAHLKIRNGEGKALLRDVMAPLLPQAILRRRKMGFPVPTVPLLRNLNGASREILLGRGSACRSWFDAAIVSRLLDEHNRGQVARDRELFTLLVFELWHGLFLDGRPTPTPERPPRLAAEVAM